MLKLYGSIFVKYNPSRMCTRVRFAPSPTGMLHLGGLRTALYNFMFARGRGGKFLLRIEDTDQTRLVPGATEKLLDVLQWAGLTPDEGPLIGGDHGPYVQSQRLDLYHESVTSLLKNGAAYKCFCTEKRLDLLRKAALRLGETPKYDNKCRYLSASEIQEKSRRNTPYVIRLKVDSVEESWEDMVFGPSTINVQLEGDPVLMKTDRYPTYHLANIVDDHYMDITHVLRGSEWQMSTGKHLVLYRAFGWSPPQFAHLPLLINRDGTKLSKRQGDAHVEHYRTSGYFPESVVNLALSVGATFSHLNNTGLTVPELIPHFSIEQISSHNSKLELERIDEFNRIHLARRLRNARGRTNLVDSLRVMVIEKFSQREANAQVDLSDSDYLDTILDWAQTRIYRLEDLLGDDFDFLWCMPTSTACDELRDLHPDIACVLRTTMRNLDSLAQFDNRESVGPVLKATAKSVDMKFAAYMKVLRLALSGLEVGPPVVEMMGILGKTLTTKRLSDTLQIMDNT